MFPVYGVTHVPGCSDIGSPRSLVPIVTENLREPLTALGDPQRQHSPLGTCPGGSQCIPASALQRTDDLQPLRREHAAVINPPEILSRSPKLRVNIGEHRSGSVDEDEARKRILPTALELEERDLFLWGQSRERPAMDHWTSAKRGEPTRLETGPRSFQRGDAQHGTPCQQRFARKKTGGVGIDRVPEDGEDAPRQFVEAAPCLPSVAIRAFDLSTLELDRNAATATAERRLQDFRPSQLRNDKESTAALIRKSETAVVVSGTRQILNLCSAHDVQQEGQTNTE